MFKYKFEVYDLGFRIWFVKCSGTLSTSAALCFSFPTRTTSRTALDKVNSAFRGVAFGSARSGMKMQSAGYGRKCCLRAGFRVDGFRFGVQGSGCRVQG